MSSELGLGNTCWAQLWHIPHSVIARTLPRLGTDLHKACRPPEEYDRLRQELGEIGAHHLVQEEVMQDKAKRRELLNSGEACPQDNSAIQHADFLQSQTCFSIASSLHELLRSGHDLRALLQRFWRAGPCGWP